MLQHNIRKCIAILNRTSGNQMLSETDKALLNVKKKNHNYSWESRDKKKKAYELAKNVCRRVEMGSWALARALTSTC